MHWAGAQGMDGLLMATGYGTGMAWVTFSFPKVNNPHVGEELNLGRSVVQDTVEERGRAMRVDPWDQD